MHIAPFRLLFLKCVNTSRLSAKQKVPAVKSEAWQRTLRVSLVPWHILDTGRC